MTGLTEKVFLRLEMPSEASSTDDKKRIAQALAERGYGNVTFPLHILRGLYPRCRDWNYEITVTLAYREESWTVTGIEPGDRRQHHYGLAVDYGSTTIVMQLVDMNTGAVLAQVSDVNGQVEYGTDILTRITYCLEDPAHMDELQQATAATFNRMLGKLAEESGVDAARCGAMTVSGNTTMVHFLLKLNAWSVFAAPYAPVTTDPGSFWGRELGLEFDGLVYFVPGASNYVGGDIVSGLLKLELHKKEQTNLFFDIGTNGELVIGNKEWIMAGAGAAGPALEGYISRYGTRARDGAVDTVTIQGDKLSFTTIGGKKPIGICGSGIIDLLAQMRLNGWVNIAGELNPSASSRICYLKDEEQYAAVYATAEESESGEPLFFTQTDIAQYLDTKAAAYTMVQCLLSTAGLDGEELEHFYLSGAFSAHSNLESAITIGMFPDLPREKFVCIRNTSLEGARILLLDRTRLREARDLAASMYCFQFASIPDFTLQMQSAKFIPHTDMNRYPSIQKRLP